MSVRKPRNFPKRIPGHDGQMGSGIENPRPSAVASNFRIATDLVIIGTLYVVLHKALYLFVPAAGNSETVRVITAILWLSALSTIIVFAWEFLSEVQPQDVRLKTALRGIIVFTSCLILLRIPVKGFLSDSPVHRLLFGISGLMNGLAVFVFFIGLAGMISGSSGLRMPVRVCVVACAFTVAMSVISLLYYFAYILTGRVPDPPSFLQPISAVSFVITNAAVLWFLFEFRRVRNFSDLAGKKDPGF